MTALISLPQFLPFEHLLHLLLDDSSEHQWHHYDFPLVQSKYGEIHALLCSTNVIHLPKSY
jgi:hypothetical protein